MSTLFEENFETIKCISEESIQTSIQCDIFYFAAPEKKKLFLSEKDRTLEGLEINQLLYLPDNKCDT